jgi:hypothetical protein
MRAQKVLAGDFQFYFPDLDNIILVESHEDESVTIRATKNNCPEERKLFFIQKLAAEGFIPDHYQWYSRCTDGSSGVLWIKDYSWLTRRPVAAPQTRRFMWKLFCAVGVLWIAMMRVVLVSDQPQPAIKTPPGKILETATLLDLAALHGRHVNQPSLVP